MPATMSAGARKRASAAVQSPRASRAAAPLVRARQLADEKHIVVTAVCRDKQTGEIVAIITSSASQPTAQHTVLVHSHALQCDCEYYRRTDGAGVCTHRAVAHDRLLTERARCARAQAPRETTRVVINGAPARIWR